MKESKTSVTKLLNGINVEQIETDCLHRHNGTTACSQLVDQHLPQPEAERVTAAMAAKRRREEIIEAAVSSFCQPASLDAEAKLPIITGWLENIVETDGSAVRSLQSAFDARVRRCKSLRMAIRAKGQQQSEINHFTQELVRTETEAADCRERLAAAVSQAELDKLCAADLLRRLENGQKIEAAEQERLIGWVAALADCDC